MSVIAKEHRTVPGAAIPTLACAAVAFILPQLLMVEPMRRQVLLALISSIGLCFGVLALTRCARVWGRELAFALLGTALNGLMLCGSVAMLLISLNQKMTSPTVEENPTRSAAAHAAD